MYQGEVVINDIKKMERYNLLDKCNPGTQTYIIAEIFSDNINKIITKREIETLYSLRWVFRDISSETRYTKDEFIRNATSIPGDVQRNLRTFYDKFNKYGLEKIEKSESSSREVCYIWNPISMDELENIVPSVARNIFKTKDEVSQFIESRKNKCEICGACKSNNGTLRLAVDHWRAHSIYNIDDCKIAVLLCEKCNNIHHNFDASKIILKNKHNIEIIRNWIKKEKEIRGYGFMPNKNDLQQQNSIKKEICNYYQSIKSPLSEDFWEGLF